MEETLYREILRKISRKKNGGDEERKGRGGRMFSLREEKSPIRGAGSLFRREILKTTMSMRRLPSGRYTLSLEKGGPAKRGNAPFLSGRTNNSKV